MKRKELKKYLVVCVYDIPDEVRDEAVDGCEDFSAFDVIEADKVMDEMEARIKELEAEVKKWKQDNRYLSAFVHLLHKGEDANSTAVIAVANKMDNLEAENERLKAQVSQNEAKLKRALWLARASEASKEVNYWNCENESSYAIVDFDVHHRTIVSYKAPHHRPYKWILIWEEVERKCRAYANKFKEET